MSTIEQIAGVLQYLSQRESTRGLPAVDQLTQRLEALVQGDQIPVPVFQCIDFEWIAASQGQYPLAVVKTDLTRPITAFYETDLVEVTRQLARLGNPRLFIVVPDSELEDDRPFSFAQSREERQQMAADYLQALPKRLPRICDAGGQVILWSKYCEDFGLVTPYEFTTQARQEIDQDPNLTPKIRRQTRDSFGFFIRKGLESSYVNGIPTEVMRDRVAWYCAMYAGEGRALLASRAIPINLEDGRVPAWFQRGTNGRLPILTPVDPNRFYQSRK